MIREKLGVKKSKFTAAEMIHKMCERQLGGVRFTGKHAFSEKRRAQGNAINAARQCAVMPDFKGMGVTFKMQFLIEMFDFIIDPCIVSIGTAFHNRIETGIEKYSVATFSHPPRQ